MPTTRKAIVTNSSDRTDRLLERTQRLLPSNYTAEQVGEDIVITGQDSAGWTIEDYVQPRLASGGIYFREIEVEDEPEDDNDTTFLCTNCEVVYDAENEGIHISEATHEAFCDECWYQQFNEASHATLVEDGEATGYLVTEHGAFDSQYMEEVEGLLVRTYHSTDGWRGYYETKPVGDWREMAQGWTTGNWGDVISDSKQAFNDWVASVLRGDTILDRPVWIIADLTSNVFSTTMGIYIPKDAEDIEIPTF
jgi:hypothetical protein